LVDVFTIVGVESYTAVESVLSLVLFVSVEMPVYINTLSYVNFAIASQAAMIADRYGTSMIVGGLCGSAVVIFLIVVLLLYVRRVFQASEMESSAKDAIESFESKILQLCGASAQSKPSPFPALAEGQSLELGESQSPSWNCLAQDFHPFLPQCVLD
jgi:hypothetical protein